MPSVFPSLSPNRIEEGKPMKFRKKSRISTSIPTASMPDIIFMLLFFFMVATVIRQYSGLKTDLPEAFKIKKIEGSKRHVVRIWADRKGNLICDETEVKKLTDLHTILARKIELDPQIQIALKIDKSLEMGFVDKLHQELRKANALKINYFAKPSPE